MAYEEYHSVDERGLVRQHSKAAIARHIADEVGDLSDAVRGIKLLVKSGGDAEEMIISFIESAFPQGGPAYDSARLELSDALGVS